MPKLTGASSTQVDVGSILGVPPPPPPAPSADATLSTVPALVSSTPRAGQGVALDETGKLAPTIAVQAVPVVSSDPANPVIGQVWYRQDTSQLSIRHDASTTKRVTFS